MIHAVKLADFTICIWMLKSAKERESTACAAGSWGGSINFLETGDGSHSNSNGTEEETS